MSHSNLRYVLSLCGGLALLTACPGDDSPPEVTTNNEDTGTTEGPSTVTMNPTTVTVTDTTPDTTTGTPDTTTEPDPDTTAGPTTNDTEVATTEPTGTTAGSESGSSSSGGGGGFDCEDVDLGSAVAHTEMGNNTGFGNDFQASCSFKGGDDEDVLYEWTAPADGTYVFDTFGSPIDTILTLMSACDGTEIDCNDDANMDTLQSELTLDMLAGESVLISIDGWNEAGDFVLNIDEVGGGGSSSGSSGGMMATGFGDCANNDPAVACLPDELCFGDMAMTVAVCTYVGCAVAADCPAAPPGGTAPVECIDANNDMVVEECVVSCAMGETCPTGMTCFAGFVCAWPVVP